MALTRPILYTTVAFDASQEHTFIFNVVGGDQVTKNRLTIIRQSDNSIVYQSIQEGFAYNHIVQANSLVNGVYYSAYIETYNYENDISSPSDSIQFYCYSTPIFAFQNFPISGIINNSSFNFEVYYNQEENEILNSYIFNLYNSQGSLVSTSGTLYNTHTTLPILISYIFSGLEDNTNYYIQVNGITIQGTQISTPMQLFYVQYTQPSVYSVIELNNNCEGGYITLKSNLREIDGVSNPENPIYVDDDTAIDLTGVGNYVLWDSGYSINGDFTASLWGHDFNEDSTIITMENENTILTIKYRKNEDNFYYVELIVKNENIIYYIYSNPIFILENDELQVFIRRINNLYDINLFNLSSGGNLPLILNSNSQGLIGINVLV